MNVRLLYAVIAVQNGNRLRHFCLPFGKSLGNVHCSLNKSLKGTYKSYADDSRIYINVRAHARIRIRMCTHTYTRAYAIYKVARDREITWERRYGFLYFLHLCVADEWFLSKFCCSVFPNIRKHTENSGFGGQYVW